MSPVFDANYDGASISLKLCEAADGEAIREYRQVHCAASKRWTVTFSSCKLVCASFGITTMKGEGLAKTTLHQAYGQISDPPHITLFFANDGKTTLCVPPTIPLLRGSEGTALPVSPGFGVDDTMEVSIVGSTLVVLKNGKPYYKPDELVGELMESVDDNSWRPTLMFHYNATLGATALVQYLDLQPASSAQPELHDTSNGYA